MIARLALLALSLGGILTLPGYALLQTTTEVRVISHVEYMYGAEMSFHAEIQAPAQVLRSTLFYRVGSTTADPLSALLSVDDLTRAIATLELRTYPLPPYASVEYWWHIDFLDGSTFETVPSTFRYVDNRFTWLALTETPVSVSWIDGDYEFGQAALDIALQSVEDITRDLAIQSPARLEIYIYPNAAQLQSGLRLGGRTWVGGHAEPELGVVLLAIPPDAQERFRLERDIPHELTHILLYERLGKGYVHLPTWLNEGFAVLNEKSPRAEYTVALEAANEADELLSIESLCASFPFLDTDAHMAYAQSASFVKYIKDIYGVGGMVRLLDAYQQGASCTLAIQRVYQRSLGQLEEEWIQAVLRPSGPDIAVREILPWAALSAPLVILMIVTIQERSRRREKEASMREPDER